MATRGSDWSARGFKAKCEFLRTVVLDQRLATPDLVAAYWPGGEENRETDRLGKWVECWGALRGMLWQMHPEKVDARASLERILADRQVYEALSATPERVALEGTPGEEPPSVWVYPKSIDALVHLHDRDRQLEIVQTVLAAMLADPIDALSVDDALTRHATVARFQREAVYQHQLCAWAATSSGPGLPWDERAEDRPDVLEAVRAWTVTDLARIHAAYRRVNLLRNAAIQALFDPAPSDDPARRLSWSVFAGSLADSRGDDPSRLCRDVSLGELLASTNVASRAQREAHERAKAKSTNPHDADPIGVGAVS